MIHIQWTFLPMLCLVDSVQLAHLNTQIIHVFLREFLSDNRLQEKSSVIYFTTIPFFLFVVLFLMYLVLGFSWAKLVILQWKQLLVAHYRSDLVDPLTFQASWNVLMSLLEKVTHGSIWKTASKEYGRVQ